MSFFVPLSVLVLCLEPPDLVVELLLSPATFKTRHVSYQTFIITVAILKCQLSFHSVSNDLFIM